MNRTLADILDVKPGEERVAGLALALSFFIGLAAILLCSSATALFLTYFDVHDFALVFIGVACLQIVIGYVFNRLEPHISGAGLSLTTLALLIVSMGLFRLGIQAHHEAVSVFLLMIWFDIFLLLANLSFWSLCGRIFDLRQAKRLYGLIDAGKYMAYIPAGYLSPLLAGVVGVGNFLILAAGALGLGLIFAVLLSRHSRPGSGAAPTDKRASRQPGKRFKDPYLLVLHAIWGLSVAGLYLVDIIFNSQAEMYYPQADALAGFVGLFFAVSASAALIIRGLLAGRLINRIGVVKVLYVLPACLLALSLVLALAPLTPMSAAAIFALAVFLRFTDYVLDHSLKTPAFMVLYQPFDPRRRTMAQTSVESLAGSCGILVVGGLLLAGRVWFDINAVSGARLLLVMGLMWIGVLLTLRRQYAQMLTRAMREDLLTSGAEVFQDRLSLDIIKSRLQGADPAEVLNALSFLETHAPDQLAPLLADLLRHASPTVVLKALEIVERQKPAGLLPQTLDLLGTADRPEVVCAALKAHAAIAGSAALKSLLPFLEHTDPVIRLGAMVGIMRHMGGEGLHAAGVQLVRMLHSRDPQARRTFGLALAEIGKAGYYRPLLDLLQDPEPQVRLAAVNAAQTLRHPQLVEPLIANLHDGQFQVPVTQALAAIGPPAISGLTRELNNKDHFPDVIQGIVQTLAQIASPKVDYVLDRHLDYPDTKVRQAVLEALCRRNWQTNAPQRIRALILDEARTSALYLQAVGVVPDTLTFVSQALERELAEGAKRVLALLALMHPTALVMEARSNLDHPERDKRVYALETLDTLLPQELKRVVFPLIDDLTPQDRLAALLTQFTLPGFDFDQLLIHLLTRSDAFASLELKKALIRAMAGLGSPLFVAPLTRMRDQGQKALRPICADALSQMATPAGRDQGP